MFYGMNDMFQSLMKLAPPIDLLSVYTDKDWLRVEQALGTKLPEDYKQYIRYYGLSYVCEFLRVPSPFVIDGDYLNLKRFSELQSEAFRITRDKFGTRVVPYPIYPEEGGLLAWGVTDNGDVIYWRTVGDPNSWTIVVNESRSDWYEEFPFGMVEFVVKVITGELVSEILPVADLDRSVVIQPHR